jgi:hypothetical protein
MPLQKLRGSYLLKRSSTFCGTQKFITEFTRADHLFLKQMNAVHALPFFLFKIYFNVIFQSMPVFQVVSSHHVFSQNHVYLSLLPHTCHMPHPSHPP